MAKQVMNRKASDNKYFHPDFHGALSAALDYLDRTLGEDAVRDYLRQFARSYYAPLKEAIMTRGLAALKDHYRKVYEEEHGKIRLTQDQDELRVTVEACPAVMHMRKAGLRVARLFSETTRTVNAAICENTPFSSDLLEYDEQTGRAVVRFWRT